MVSGAARRLVATPLSAMVKRMTIALKPRPGQSSLQGTTSPMIRG